MAQVDKTENFRVEINNGDLLLPVNHVSENRFFTKKNLRSFVFKSKNAVGGNFRLIDKSNYVHCLQNINLLLNSGDRVALIGHNGSGKTSLLKIIAGIYPLSGGTIKIDGIISNFISQGLGANLEMSAIDFLELQCIFRNYNKSKTNDIIKNVLSFIELGEFAFLPMRTYSAGMQARVYASSALFFPGDILVLDEGLSAGDSFFNSKFKKKLDEYFENAKVLIIASHDPIFLKKWCRKGIVMKRGEIIFSGSIRKAFEFYSSELYENF